MMDIEHLRAAVAAAISPIKPAGPDTKAPRDFLFKAERTDAGRNLPPYYLVYFLLVDLLGFKNIGRFEKVAWSVPIDFEGKGFVIEHRKFGIGVFATDLPADEEPAATIVQHISRAVKIAQPYFEWRAQQAVAESKLNVLNRSNELYDRFEFFASLYDEKRSEAERLADERITTKLGEHAWTTHFPAIELRQEAKWLALSTIESFFSWTEHVFILLSILNGKCATGSDVARLAAADWGEKFKAALDITERKAKHYYDELTVIRQQLRNFVAHGSFGKQGEAFQFHSGAGAVPVRLPQNQDKRSFRFGHGIEFVDHDAIVLIRNFVEFFWSEDRSPAKIYIQSGLPLILTMVSDGKYGAAMFSDEDMEHFVEYLGRMMDDHANMDF